MTDAPRRTGWYYGWNIVVLAALSQMFVLGLATNCFTLFLPAWREAFGVPVSSLALAFTIFALACAFIAAPAGWAADKYSARWMMGLGLGLVALFQIAVAFATAGWQVLALYCLSSVAVTCAASVPAQALVSRWFVRRRGLALGLSAFGLASAGVLLPPLVVWMLKTLGWRETWWLSGAFVGLVIMPIFVLSVRDRPKADDPFGYMTGADAAAAQLPSPTMKDIVTRRNFWVLGVVFICVFCAYQAALVNLTPIVLSHGLTLAAAGALLSAISFADLLAKLAAGALADRIGNRPPLVGLALAAALGALLLAFAHGAVMVIASLMLLGLGGAVWTLLASATAAEFGHNGFGKAFGLVCTFAPFGAVSPPVLARVQEATGSYTPGLVGLALLALAGAGIGLLLQDKAVTPVGIAPAPSVVGGSEEPAPGRP